MTSKVDIPGHASSATQPPKLHRGHEVTSKTIKTPHFSYACLQLTSESPTPSGTQFDALTLRSYIGSALSQFLGLTGSAISIEILRVEGRECWVRVLREDLGVVIAAVGGWTGGSEVDGKVGWKVKASGNWLSVLIAQEEADQIWNQ